MNIMKRAWLALPVAFMLLSLISARDALAQGQGDKQNPQIYVFPLIKAPNVSEVAFNRIQRDFLNVFSMSMRFKVILEKDLKIEISKKEIAENRKVKAKGLPWLDKADTLLWKGMDLIEKGDYKAAIESLMEAREIYESHYAELRDYEKMVDSSLQLAIAFFKAGYKDNGEELLKDVIVWRPNLVVNKKKYPKDFVESLEKMKARLTKTATGTIYVEATPPEGAKVYVDGVLKGTLSQSQRGVDLPGLIRGKHFVQIFKDGHKPWGKQTGVPKAGRTKKIVAELVKKEEKKKGGLTGALEKLSFEIYKMAQIGEYGFKFNQKANEFCEKTQMPYLLFGFINKEETGSKLTLFLFKNEWKATGMVEPVLFSKDLANLSVYLLYLEANLDGALSNFPKNKVVQGTPEVYKKALAKPAVVVTPVKPTRTGPAVVVAPVKPATNQPTVKVVKPTKTGPVKATTNDGAALPSRTGNNNNGYGDLSSVFGNETPNQPKPYNPPKLGKTKDNDSGSITEKWWFWSGVAVVGAGVLGGGGYLLYDSMSSGGASGYNVDFSWK
jgi:PEGA domain